MPFASKIATSPISMEGNLVIRGGCVSGWGGSWASSLSHIYQHQGVLLAVA